MEDIERKLKSIRKTPGGDARGIKGYPAGNRIVNAI
jgi:hypothetical protein